MKLKTIKRSKWFTWYTHPLIRHIGTFFIWATPGQSPSTSMAATLPNPGLIPSTLGKNKLELLAKLPGVAWDILVRNTQDILTCI